MASILQHRGLSRVLTRHSGSFRLFGIAFSLAKIGEVDTDLAGLSQHEVLRSSSHSEFCRHYAEPYFTRFNL